MTSQSQASSTPLNAQKTAQAPVRTFGIWAVGLAVVLGPISFGVLDVAQAGLISIAMALLVYGLGVVIAARAVRRGFPHSILGWCNVVTLARLAMVAALLVVLFSGTPPSWGILAYAIVALSLDGVDGWLARRQNLTSDFGARFDMEVDALFALVLSLMAYSNGVAGPFVLLLGVPSYLFFAAKFVFPWLDNALPDLFSRKVICVAQLSVLIALQVPFNLGAYLAPLTGAVAVALVWSFGRDIVWLARMYK